MPTPNHRANDYWPGEYFFVSNATSMVSSVAEIQNFTIGATSGTFTLRISLSAADAFGSFLFSDFYIVEYRIHVLFRNEGSHIRIIHWVS